MTGTKSPREGKNKIDRLLNLVNATALTRKMLECSIAQFYCRAVQHRWMMSKRCDILKTCHEHGLTSLFICLKNLLNVFARISSRKEKLHT